MQENTKNLNCEPKTQEAIGIKNRCGPDMADLTDRLWSKESEAGVLGSMMLDNECIPEILSILTAESFYIPDHQLVFKAIESLHTARNPVDGVSLRTQLIKDGRLEQVGGVEYIAKILQSVPSAANVKYYAGVVRDKEKYRKLVETTWQMQDVLVELIDTDEQIQKIQDLALDVGPFKDGDGCYSVKDYATRAAMALLDDSPQIFQTGYSSIDRILGGITPGDFVIIAGRPSMGKTSLALGLALKAAQAGRSVVFFTLEMTAYSLMQRACSSLGRINLAKIKEPNSQPELLEQYTSAALELQKLPLVIYENASTPEKQIAIVKARRKVHPVDLVVIDYIQLMNTGRGNENRQQEITTISRKLTRLAKELHIPILVLSQLNRLAEGRTNHRPRLSDLRDSGALEQDADVVMLLYREDYYRRNESPDSYQRDGTAEIIIAKNRQGPTGIARMAFVEDYSSFEELFGDDIG